MSLLSVVIPAYNEEQNIKRTSETIGGILDGASIEHELVFIDDGSGDLTWKAICDAAEAVSNVRGVRFSRNFGKEAAIYAGLSAANGDCVVVIDCDLQHPPEKILEMYALWEQGFEVVEGIKSSRGKESVLHGLFAGIFYRLISSSAHMELSDTSDFKLLDRRVVEALVAMPERDTFFRALSSWVGFSSTKVTYEVQERTAGETSWSTAALVRYAVSNITSFTTVPMQVITLMGIGMFFLGVGVSVDAVISHIRGIAAEGFTTIIILLSFIGSGIMISLGINGIYIAKIYEEVKCRPRYIIESTVGGKDK